MRITLHLCVLYVSQNKQQLLPYTAWTDGFFIAETECVYCAVSIESDTIRLWKVNFIEIDGYFQEFIYLFIYLFNHSFSNLSSQSLSKSILHTVRSSTAPFNLQY